jgi:hypothetical protein
MYPTLFRHLFPVLFIFCLAAVPGRCQQAVDAEGQPPCSAAAPAANENPILFDHPSGEHTHARAGYPLVVAWYARPSDTGRYIGYYVGGGCLCRGQHRCCDEGTWGWDYGGFVFPKRVILKWCHGCRYQAGIGYYRTIPQPNLQSPSTP